MENILNKKGFTAQNFVVSLLIFGACLALFVVMVGSIANDYDNAVIIDDEFSSNFDKFSESTDIAGEMYDSISGEGGLSLFAAADLFFTAGFSVIRLLFSAVETSAVIMFTFPTYFGINTAASVIMMTLIFTILTVIIVFSIINSLRGNRL